MEKIFALVISKFTDYIGDGRYFIVFAVLLVLGFLFARKRQEIHYFFHFTLLLGVVLFVPVTANLIMSCMGKKVYWRLFWMVPLVLVIAFVLTKFIKFVKPVPLKSILIAVCCEMLVIMGSFIYSEGQFIEVPNEYKLPSDTLQVAEILEEDAGQEGNIYVSVPNTLACSIRQYSSRFILPYGRNYISKAKQDDRYDLAMDLMEKVRDPHVYPPYVLEALEDYGCDYLVLSKNDGRIYALAKYDCVELGQSNSYVVYKLPEKLADSVHEEAEALRKRDAEEAAKAAEKETSGETDSSTDNTAAAEETPAATATETPAANAAS